MLRNFLTQLTRVTDTMIIIASALVVLAFLTAPEDPSLENSAKAAVAATTSARTSLDNAEAMAKKASDEAIAARNALAAALEQETNLTSADIASTDELSSASAATEAARNALAAALEQETNLTSADIASTDELSSASAATEAARNALETAEQSLMNATEKAAIASASVTAAESRAATEIAAAESAASKSVWWLQPIRQNTMVLINAAGIDGFIAVFAALIFCLVYKRRKSWLQKI